MYTDPMVQISLIWLHSAVFAERAGKDRLSSLSKIHAPTQIHNICTMDMKHI